MLRRVFKRLDQALAKLIICFIRLYQRTLSPDKWLLAFWLRGRICSHEPHCSEYGARALKRYGFDAGFPLLIERVLHCLPSMHTIYDPEFYKVIFISSAPIGVPFLECLAADPRFEVSGIITQPDKPVGRGLKMQANIIKTKALELGIPAEQIKTPNKIHPEKSEEGKAFYERLLEQKPDFLVVLAYGKIIPQAILDIPAFGAINVHGSLLPKYRGASPIQTIFLDQEAESGITIMHMDAGMDTGAIVDQLSFPLPFAWNCLDCIEHMQKIGPKFLNQTLRKYAKRELKATAQDEHQAIYCQKIQKADWIIDPFAEPLEAVYAKYRAYYLWPKISFTHQGKLILIELLELDQEAFEQGKDLPLLWKDFQLHPAIRKMLLKPEGKKAMDWQSFKNGYLS